MAEDELTQTGIRVGGWLPAVPAEPARPAEQPGPVPRRLPANGETPAAPHPAPPSNPPDRASDAPAPPAGPGDPPPIPGSDRASRPGAAVDRPPAALDQRPPAGPARATGRPVPGAAAPARHSAPESVTDRLTGLLGSVAATVRADAGVADASRATRLGLARARRRRLVLTAAVLVGLVLVLAYANRGPQRAGEPPAVAAPPTAGTAPAGAGPGGAAPTEAAAPPTIVPVTGNPAFPGGPLLTLDQETVPTSVNLTVLGTRDWIHWGGTGGDSVQRKQISTGEIRDPGGARLEHQASPSGFTWSDGTPIARQQDNRYGVFQRGTGRSFSVSVAGSDDLRTVRLFVGAFSAAARLDVRLSTGGDPAVREVPLAAGDRFFAYVIHFRAPREARLELTWRALAVVGGENDGVTLEAMTVS